MRVDWKSMLVGAAVAVVTLGAVGALLLHLAFAGAPAEQHHRTLKLASGRTLEVTALYLAFSDEHSGRGAIDDGISVEYVSASAEPAAHDIETGEVFEAVRPLAESLGVEATSVSAFPSLVRKGHYVRRDYTRGAAEGWTSTRTEAKVFVND